MSSEELKNKIKELEKELERIKNDSCKSLPAREKIEHMSSEVVDANPYR